MTNEEALDYLRSIPIVDGVHYEEPIRLAINALEKQIPKKPDFSEFGNRFCSSCGKIVRYYTISVRNNYCPDCGQAIDWSDSDD